MFKVNSKDTRTKPIEVVAVSFGVNQNQKQPLELFYKKAILKNFAIFTGKQLCWSMFWFFSREYCETFQNTYFEKHLPIAASINCKNFYRATEGQIEMKCKQKLKLV